MFISRALVNISLLQLSKAYYILEHYVILSYQLPALYAKPKHKICN